MKTLDALESAYIFILRMPMNSDARIMANDTLAKLRDAIVELLNQSGECLNSESIQLHYEAIARNKT